MKVKGDNKNIDKETIYDSKIIGDILFSRLSKITLINGALFILLAIINIPFLYNPELDQLTLNLTGKPTIGFITTFTMYLFLGIIPLVIGIIFIIFSFGSGRKIQLIFFENGMCRYIKRGTSNFLLSTQIDFNIKDTIQQIRLGQRHQRFIIWAPLAIMLFIVFMLLGYFNYLDPTFDVQTRFFEIEYSLKGYLILNIALITMILLPFALFPRKLCKIDTNKEFIQFDYTSFQINKATSEIKTFSYLAPFTSLKEKHGGKGLLEDIQKSAELPENLNDMKIQKDLSHVPLLSIISGIGLIILGIIPQLIPNFFLGPFTFRIEYFLILGGLYLSVRTLQKEWFTDQQITAVNSSNYLIRRKNKIFGNKTILIAEPASIEQESIPKKPHYLEHALWFFAVMEMIWFLSNIFSFSEYFFTQNIYTLFYILIIGLAFWFLIYEFFLPKPYLHFTPLNQQSKRRKSESFILYFPSESVQKNLNFGKQLFKPKYIRNAVRGLLLILIPVIFTIFWMILSAFGLVQSIYMTIF